MHVYSEHPIKDIKPDSRMRVHLGELAAGADGFKVFKDEAGRLVLEPYSNIPLYELAVLNNKELIAELDEAHRQLQNGEGVRLNWSDWE